jgi:hypothetical protein
MGRFEAHTPFPTLARLNRGHCTFSGDALNAK